MAAIRSAGTEIAVAVPVIQSEDKEQESVSHYQNRIMKNVLGNRDEFLRILRLRTPRHELRGRQGVLLEHEPTHLISSTKDKQVLDLLLIVMVDQFTSGYQFGPTPNFLEDF